jgi:hypothetical protein
MKSREHYKYHLGQARDQLRRVFHVPHWNPGDPAADNRRGLHSWVHTKYHLGQVGLELRKLFHEPHWSPGPDDRRSALRLVAVGLALVIGLFVGFKLWFWASDINDDWDPWLPSGWSLLRDLVVLAGIGWLAILFARLIRGPRRSATP